MLTSSLFLTPTLTHLWVLTLHFFPRPTPILYYKGSHFSLSLVYLSPKQTHIRRPLAHYHTHVSFELGQPHSLAHLSNNAISNFNPTHSLTLFFLSVLRERLYLLSQSFTQFQSTWLILAHCLDSKLLSFLSRVILLSPFCNFFAEVFPIQQAPNARQSVRPESNSTRITLIVFR